MISPSVKRLPKWGEKSLSRKKRIVLLFLTHGRQRSVSTCEHRIARQSEYFLFVVPQLFVEGGDASTHRACKDGVPHYCQWPTEPGNIVGRHPGGVTRCEQRL